jgi:hypothetical protein
MKRLLPKFVLILSFIGLIFASSCEPVDNRPECEKLNQGTVVVKNYTGYSLWVDVTEGSSFENDERRIYNGSSTTYYNIAAGSIRVWASYDGVDWVYNNQSLSSCYTLTYTWNSKKKSAEANLELFLDEKPIETFPGQK